MARLDFSLVWLFFLWFGLFSCLKKLTVKEPVGKNSRGKEQAWKRPNGEMTGREKPSGKKLAGKRPTGNDLAPLHLPVSTVNSLLSAIN